MKASESWASTSSVPPFSILPKECCTVSKLRLCITCTSCVNPRLTKALRISHKDKSGSKLSRLTNQKTHENAIQDTANTFGNLRQRFRLILVSLPTPKSSWPYPAGFRSASSSLLWSMISQRLPRNGGRHTQCDLANVKTSCRAQKLWSLQIWNHRSRIVLNPDSQAVVICCSIKDSGSSNLAAARELILTSDLQRITVRKALSSVLFVP